MFLGEETTPIELSHYSMRVTHVITGLSTGGAQMMLFKLLSASHCERQDSQVISLTDIGPMGERIQRLGVQVYSLGMKRGLPSLKGLLRLVRSVCRSSPQVVHTWLYHADLMGGLATKLAGNIPTIWGVRNGLLESNSSKRHTIWTARTCALLSRWLPNKIACVSETARLSHVKMGYAANKFVVIPNGFDLSLFKRDPDARPSMLKELGLPPDVLLVGLIARFDPQKDHENFIRAAALATKRHAKAHFILCGEGVTADNTRLCEWITTHGLSENLHLLGSREDIPRITASLDAAVNSSFGEAFPNAVGEAMASGVPCVVTSVGDSAMLVGTTGKVVPPRDSTRLAQAVVEIIELGQEGRNKLGLEARKRVEAHFDLKVIARRYDELYRQVFHGN